MNITILLKYNCVLTHDNTNSLQRPQCKNLLLHYGNMFVTVEGIDSAMDNLNYTAGDYIRKDQAIIITFVMMPPYSSTLKGKQHN